MATKKDVLVKLDEKVEVIGTGKYGLTINKKYTVHPIMAKRLVAKGAARYSKEPKAEK